ncbi:MAG: 3-phosphoshikimate 1-carboxyvinyltransferase [Deltaproteobacteria bacterium RIFCSPLOWO2_02_FULL_53_8]|nr:MAG: 3-phosphoshikimate 1-carboxyvinyltransferase [Deltaproteobacteria bacterium RIFCSPLOWO2_02_FULL_53_8]
MSIISKNSDGSITVSEARGLNGEVRVPGDKSISHRAVILGAITDGITTVGNFLSGEDNLSTLNAFKQMGVAAEIGTDKASLSYNFLTIHGRGQGRLAEPEDVIDVGNSGTTARLLTGLLSAQPFFSVITGDASLRKRPMRRVVEPLRLMGAQINGRNDSKLLPLAIKGGSLQGKEYKTPIASAQLKSALLLAGLFADGETIVEEPALSRDHTERMLKAFGADIKVDGLRTTVTSKNKLKGDYELLVPCDISSAAFFMVGAMITSESDLFLRNVGVNPTRTGIIDILKKMGGFNSINVLNEREDCGEPVADICVKRSSLNGVDISGPELLPAIDEFPIICIAAAFAYGRTTIIGAGELRVKESDRIAVMANSLRAVGIVCEEKEDGIVIDGRGGYQARRIKGGTIDSLGDHRIAMAFAIAGLRATDGITIKNPDCATVSFPGFYDLLEKISQ